MIEIKHRFTGAVLYTHDGADLRHADLSGADLSGADLSGADLSGADLSGANLRDANLRDANLRDADLYGANLCGSNLCGSNLYGANLYGANLYGADLRRANLSAAGLRDADLRYANLSGAVFSDVPTIPDIHQAVYAAASQPGCLDMAQCRAGWVVTLAGAEGKDLEERTSTSVAAALIYQASDPTPPKVPDFYTANDNALADMARLAGVTS